MADLVSWCLIIGYEWRTDGSMMGYAMFNWWLTWLTDSLSWVTSDEVTAKWCAIWWLNDVGLMVRHALIVMNRWCNDENWLSYFRICGWACFMVSWIAGDMLADYGEMMLDYESLLFDWWLNDSQLVVKLRLIVVGCWLIIANENTIYMDGKDPRPVWGFLW